MRTWRWQSRRKVQSLISSSMLFEQADNGFRLAAERFVEAYYEALQSQPATIASFYHQPKTLPDGKALPSIVFNGDVKPNGAEMQNMFEDKVGQMQFEVQAVDAQCLNLNYVAEGTIGGNAAPGQNMTILVSVNGSVKFGDLKTASAKGFNDNLVLVPSQDGTGPQTRAKQIRNYVIQSQIFRIVV